MHNRNFKSKGMIIFNFMFKAIMTVVILGFVGIISFWVFVGVYVVDGSKNISENGLKTVVENIWCGKANKECKLPELVSTK